MRRLAVIVGAVAVLVVGAGVAQAVIPDAEGQVHVCYDKSGDVRVVEEGIACEKGETALSLTSQVQAPRIYVVNGNITSIEPGESGAATALCNQGDVATGGGFFNNAQPDFKIISSSVFALPGGTQYGWRVTAYNLAQASGGVQATATCLDYTP
jgi:hypothetical protein